MLHILEMMANIVDMLDTGNMLGTVDMDDLVEGGWMDRVGVRYKANMDEVIEKKQDEVTEDEVEQAEEVFEDSRPGFSQRALMMITRLFRR